jgi:hypothetical protein
MYELSEQTSLDITWYFRDSWARLCVAMSAGGFLPERISENDQANDKFHDLVMELPERYEIRRNEAVISQIEGLTPNGLDQYFSAFEPFAKKGLYVFDKHRLSNPEDPFYLLVVVPIYRRGIDPYPVKSEDLELLPQMRGGINPRTLRPVNLTHYLSPKP